MWRLATRHEVTGMNDILYVHVISLELNIRFNRSSKSRSSPESRDAWIIQQSEAWLNAQTSSLRCT